MTDVPNCRDCAHGGSHGEGKCKTCSDENNCFECIACHGHSNCCPVCGMGMKEVEAELNKAVRVNAPIEIKLTRRTPQESIGYLTEKFMRSEAKRVEAERKLKQIEKIVKAYSKTALGSWVTLGLVEGILKGEPNE